MSALLDFGGSTEGRRTEDAAVCGTKQPLWERLVKCEAFYDEKERVRNAILDRHTRTREGCDPELLATLEVPEKPDAETVLAHELTHAKFEPWCFECVLGKAVDRQHPTQQPSGKDPEIPVIQVDYHFMKDDGEEATELEERFSTTLGRSGLRHRCYLAA